VSSSTKISLFLFFQPSAIALKRECANSVPAE
jgi:hypothetical protein